MMETMRMDKLAMQIRGVSYKPEDLHETLDDSSIILLRANNIDEGKINFDDVVFIDRKKVSNEQLLQKGDILICASSGSKNLVGKAAMINFDQKVTFGAFCKVVRPYCFQDADYLSMFFQSPIYRREISSASIGANINNIRNEHIDTLNVRWPDKVTRSATVAILRKVNLLVHLRKEELNSLDTLIKARFVEMFGDLVTNPKGWVILPWEKVFDTKTGKLDSNASVEGGNYPFFTCAKEWLWIDKYAYDCEALLLAGNNAAGVYDVKHYKGKFNAYQRTYILQLKNNDWSYSLFKYQLEDKLLYLQNQSKGTNTRYLTMGILNTLSFIVPPIYLQEKFSTFFAQVDKSKDMVKKSLGETQLLFDSLMQQYFG